MNSGRSFFVIIFVFLFMLILNQDLQAQGKFGVRTGVYTDLSDLFIGGEYVAPVGSNVFLNPNIEYIFVSNGNYWAFNFDAHYAFPTYSSVYVWVGGGLGMLHYNPDGPADANTDPAMNLLFGLGFNTASNLIPYIQGKAIISDNTDFEFGFGLRF